MNSSQIEDVIEKILRETASPKEITIFNDWLKESDENLGHYNQLKRIWVYSATYKDFKSINDKNGWQIVKERINESPKSITLSKILPILKTAAIIIFAFIIGSVSMYFLGNRINEIQYTPENDFTVSVPLGSKSQIELSDGTKVWLNSGSKINYPAKFGSKKREVFLTGEAYFEVTKDEDLPFFVHANEVEIKVLGTSFNVKTYPEERSVETILVEGLINIRRKGSKNKLQLLPGEKATYLRNIEGGFRKHNDKFYLAKNIETELYTSWRNEQLIFKRKRFKELAVTLERWYNVHITIKNKELAETKVTGIFKTESIEQALEALKMSVSFSYKITNNNIQIK